MPRKSKTDTAAKSATKTKAVKATKKTATKKEVVQKVEKVAEVNETVSAEVTKEQELSSEFTNILSVIGTLSSQLSALKTQVRALEKKAVRELKAANKANVEAI